MAPEEAQQNAPRRRGRPPGSKNRTLRKRAEGGELDTRLNTMVAKLISENRTLRNQVEVESEELKAADTQQVCKALHVVAEIEVPQPGDNGQGRRERRILARPDSGRVVTAA